MKQVRISSYKYGKRWRAKTKEWLVEYAGGSCQSCGYAKYRGNLAFHHISDKVDRLSELVRQTASWGRILSEVQKCVLVCHNCHGEIHAGLIPCPDIDYEARRARLSKLESSRPIPKSNRKRPCSWCKKMTSSASYCSGSCSSAARYGVQWPDDSELARLVLSLPISTIAKQIGVSDKAVSKRCKQRNISTPTVGHWVKIHGFGKRVH